MDFWISVWISADRFLLGGWINFEFEFEFEFELTRVRVAGSTVSSAHCKEYPDRFMSCCLVGFDFRG